MGSDIGLLCRHRHIWGHQIPGSIIWIVLIWSCTGICLSGTGIYGKPEGSKPKTTQFNSLLGTLCLQNVKQIPVPDKSKQPKHKSPVIGVPSCVEGARKDV